MMEIWRFTFALNQRLKEVFQKIVDNPKYYRSGQDKAKARILHHIVCENGNNFENFAQDMLQNPNYEDEILPRGKNILNYALKEVVNSCIDSDDFATAFAGYITLAIRYNLIETNVSYVDFFCDVVNEIPADKFEDTDKLKSFLKGFSRAICNNNYDRIESLYNEFDYSITSVYLLCHYMYLYSQNIEDEDILQKMINIYLKMNEDMLDYVMMQGVYEKISNEVNFNILTPYQLYPFCYIGSYKTYFSNDLVDNVMLLDNTQSDIMQNAILVKIASDIALIRQDDLSYKWSTEPVSNIPATAVTRRMHALHIPTTLPNMNVFKRLFQANAELEKTNTALEKEKKEKETIIDRFSHRYRQMGATALYTTAQALFEMDSEACKEHGRVVLEEYNIKENLTTSIGILELSFTGKNDEIKENIQNSVSKVQQTNCSILVLVNNLIKKSLLQLFYGVTNKDEKIRQVCFKDNIDKIKDSFNKEVLFKDKSNAIEWFNHNIAKLDITISDSWKQIFFEEHGYADVAISDLLVDIVQNAIKYADKEETIFLEFTDENDYMVIKSKNKVRKNKTKLGRKKGLKAQNAFLNTLNRTIKEIDNSIEYNESNGEFFIKAKINKLLLGG